MAQASPSRFRTSRRMRSFSALVIGGVGWLNWIGSNRPVRASSYDADTLTDVLDQLRVVAGSG
jgi:hypothetical protein